MLPSRMLELYRLLCSSIFMSLGSNKIKRSWSQGKGFPCFCSAQIVGFILLRVVVFPYREPSGAREAVKCAGTSQPLTDIRGPVSISGTSHFWKPTRISSLMMSIHLQQRGHTKCSGKLSYRKQFWVLKSFLFYK